MCVKKSMNMMIYDKSVIRNNFDLEINYITI